MERIPEIVFPIFFNLHNSPCEETVNRGLVITLDVGRLVCDQVTLIRPPRSVSFSAFVFWDLSTFIFFFKRLIRASFFFCFVMLYLTFFIKSKSGGKPPFCSPPANCHTANVTSSFCPLTFSEFTLVSGAVHWHSLVRWPTVYKSSSSRMKYWPIISSAASQAKIYLF